MAGENWTVESVKEKLPDVRVQLTDGTVVRGEVVGRLLPFAYVYCGTLPWTTEVAWETLVRCLNTGQPISI